MIFKDHVLSLLKIVQWFKWKLRHLYMAQSGPYLSVLILLSLSPTVLEPNWCSLDHTVLISTLGPMCFPGMLFILIFTWMTPQYCFRFHLKCSPLNEAFSAHPMWNRPLTLLNYFCSTYHYLKLSCLFDYLLPLEQYMLKVVTLPVMFTDVSSVTIRGPNLITGWKLELWP